MVALRAAAAAMALALVEPTAQDTQVWGTSGSGGEQGVSFKNRESSLSCICGVRETHRIEYRGLEIYTVICTVNMYHCLPYSTCTVRSFPYKTAPEEGS